MKLKDLRNINKILYQKSNINLIKIVEKKYSKKLKLILFTITYIINILLFFFNKLKFLYNIKMIFSNYYIAIIINIFLINYIFIINKKIF